MIYYALKMLTDDRSKYAGLLFGVTFTSFLVTFAASYFSGLLTRSYALVSENPATDVWVMDPAVRSVKQTINMPSSALNRVRGVRDVRWAAPMALGTATIRFAHGGFYPAQVIGVDDATLAGVPELKHGASRSVLRYPNAVVVDPGGTSGKLETPQYKADQWPQGRPHLDAPTRPLAAGDDILVDGYRLRVTGESAGIPRFPPQPLLYTKYSTAERILPKEPHRLTFVLVTAGAGADPRELATRIESATGLRARTSSDFKADTVRWMLVTSEDVGDAVTMLTIAVLVGFGVTGIMMFMFTSENVKYYAVFNAMGATGRTLLPLIFAQAGFCALLGTGFGLGACVGAGLLFENYGFPFRMMWFAPMAGGAAVLLISIAGAALSIYPVLKMQPATFLTGR